MKKIFAICTLLSISAFSNAESNTANNLNLEESASDGILTSDLRVVCLYNPLLEICRDVIDDDGYYPYFSNYYYPFYYGDYYRRYGYGYGYGYGPYGHRRHHWNHGERHDHDGHYGNKPISGGHRFDGKKGGHQGSKPQMGGHRFGGGKRGR